MRGHQRLVGRHHRRAAPEESGDQRPRRLDGIERFDHDVIVAAKKIGGVGRHPRGIHRGARLTRIANERAFDLESKAGVRRYRAIGGETRDGLPDFAETEDADPNGSDLGAYSGLWRADA